ncbi:MAG: MBL fold metallo-hydrolase [Candidatus Bathyarchaeia archaeon]
MDLVFLGTGGGRFVTYMQRRWTGGIRLVKDDLHVHIDPGPGAIVRCADAKLSPEKVRLLLLSHSHPDHYCDAEVFIEGMTKGTGVRRGTLVAPPSVLNGDRVIERSISKYHQSLVREVVEAHPGDSLDVQGLGLKVTKAVHTDPHTVGYVFDLPGIGKVGYTSDTELFDGLVDYYKGLAILILCVLRPRGSSVRYHLGTEDAKAIIEATKPTVAVLTHFGMRMLNANPSAEASYIQSSTGVRTIAAADGMVLSFSDGVASTRLLNVKTESRGT